LKKLLIGAIAAAAIVAGPALAADMPVKAAAQPVVAAPYNWTGVYSGGEIGWLGTKDIGGPFVFPAAPGNSFIAPAMNGAAYGGYLGVQYQWDRIVIGFEGGVRSLFNDGFSSTAGLGNAPPIGCNAAVVFACQGSVKYVWQYGPRLGWAFDKFLVYGTGGWAGAKINTQALTIATGTLLAQAGNYHNGWFAGGGLEWAAYTVTPGLDVVLGLDYTHYEFDTRIDDIGGNSRFVSTKADAVLARVALKVGPLR
jgi:outer membrane immunogenic protein